ncbi:hypothetical protein ACEPAI_2881 [Sanghuangporus weigelae]
MAPDIVPLWINGQRRPASDGGTFEVRNPLTKDVVITSASATSQDCKDAAEAAGRAFDAWERTPAAQKRAILIKAAELIQTDKYKDKITKALWDETAASKELVMINIRGGHVNLLESASLASQVKGTSFPSSNAPGGHVIVQRRAYGAILSIAPWNAPITLSIRAIAVPLICGNTVVLKSSEYSPWCQEIVVELMHEAGIPPGVLNFISMSREASPTLISELIGNPIIRHVNFTGSDRVGRIIAGEAAKYLKPCVFELGGKAPAVVLDDADTEAAARSITYGALLGSGQICMSTERVIVQRGAASALLPALQKYFASIRAGDINSDSSARISSLINEGAAESVLNLMKEAKEAGAEVLLGDLKRDGAVVQPHVLSGIKPGMRAFDRESFGPLVGVVTVDTIDEAIELANATDYSLTASLWTRDVNRALDVSSCIRAGMVSVNGTTFHTETQIGHAGLGGATGYGRFDIQHFTVERAIVIHHEQAKYPIVDS